MGRLELHDGWVDLTARRVHRGSTHVELRPKEADLLAHLAERAGQTVGRSELLAQVWGYSAASRSRTLDSTVHRLRAKVEADPADPRHLTTDPGVGYRFVPLRPDPAPADAAEQWAIDGARRVGAAVARGGRVVLWGPPGVGKSDWVRRLPTPAITVPGGPGWLEVLAAALGLDVDVGDDLATRIGQAIGRTGVTVVIDDADAAALAVDWPRVVATRRTRPGPAPAGWTIERAEPLPPDAATALFERRVRGGATPGTVDLDPEHTRAIVAFTGGLPLAIELAARHVRWLGPAAFTARIEAEPTALFDGAEGRALRTALDVVRSALPPDAGLALDALAVLPAPVPPTVALAIAGTIDRLDTLRDAGLVVRDARGWVCPLGLLRVGGDASTRASVAARIAAALEGTFEPTCGARTVDEAETLLALRPVLEALAPDAPALLPARAFARVLTVDARAADGLLDHHPVLWCCLEGGPADRCLALLEGAPPGPARELARARSLRKLGRLGAPTEDPGTGVAVGEWAFEHYLAAKYRFDPDAGTWLARAAEAWADAPLLRERAEIAMGILAIERGELATAEHAFQQVLGAWEGWKRVQAAQGLARVALRRRDPDGAGRWLSVATTEARGLSERENLLAGAARAGLLLELGRDEDAYALISHVVHVADLAPGMTAIHAAELRSILGRVLLHRGAWQEAAVILDRSRNVLAEAGLDVLSGMIGAHGAIACELGGDVAGARERFQRAVVAVGDRPGRVRTVVRLLAAGLLPVEGAVAEGRADAERQLDPALAALADLTEAGSDHAESRIAAILAPSDGRTSVAAVSHEVRLGIRLARRRASHR